MPTPGERRKKRKFARTIKHRKVFRTAKKKASKHSCALCSRALHGVPHGKTKSGLGKLGKTEKRPSAAFAGILCSKCRESVVEEALKVFVGAKKESKVEPQTRKYVMQIMQKIGKV